MGSAAPRVGAYDPTYYPTDDEMGENALQRFIVELLRPLLASFLARQGIRAFVGADQFIYWVQHAPTTSVAPDVYVLPGVSPDIAPACWKVWETGVVPSFALEVMARDGRKDQERSPLRYDELGVRELVVFDPYVDEASGRVRFRVFRRDDQRGLVQTEATNADRIRSEVLGCFLRAIGEGPALRLRIATGAEGETIVPTDAERADTAEAEVARLRAELERRSRG